MKTGRGCEGGLGHASSHAHFLNGPAEFLAHGEQALGIATSRWGGQEQLNNTADSQRAFTASTFVELLKFTYRTGDYIDWVKR